MVTRFCASNTPTRRNETDTAASNRDWRGLVVCGTSVTRARSVSSAVDADDQRGPHLRCHAEVHQPDLAPARPCHSGCSRRSSSVNRRSAAATKSSSCGKSCAAKATRRASSATSSDRSRSGSASISSSSFCVASVTKSESHFVFFASSLGLIPRHNVANEPRAAVLQRRVGSIRMLARFSPRWMPPLRHVRPKHRVDP